MGGRITPFLLLPRPRCAGGTTLLLLLLILRSCYTQAMVMKQPQQRSSIAVIGATGRLGQKAVLQLVDQGIPCKLLFRRLPTEKPPTTLNKDSTKEQVMAYLSNLDGVSVVEGDVGNVAALETLVSGCEACLALYGATRKSKLSDMWKNAADEDPTHPKQVNYQGVINLIQACRTAGCARIVRITGKGEQPTSFFSVLINLLGSMAKAWNYQGELALRGQSDVDYTIIRPGIMVDDDNAPEEGSVLALKDNGGDLAVSKIRYSDIASLCINCLDYENAARSTLTAMTVNKQDEESEAEASSSSSSWGPLLAKVQPDQRSFPQNMLEQHYAAVRKTILGIAAVITSLGFATFRYSSINRREAMATMGFLSTGLFLPKQSSWAEDTATTDTTEGLVSTFKLADLLRVIPTFTIVDSKGVPYMVVGEDAKVTGYFFLDYEEAKRILKVADASASKAIAEAVKEDQSQAADLMNPWKNARISTVPLDFAVTLITKSLYDRRAGGNYFQIAPSPEEIDNALFITGKEDLAEGKVPLFYYEDFTLPAALPEDDDGTKKTPVYFQQKQLEEAYRKVNGRSAELPPIKVTELFALLQVMVKPGSGQETDLQNLVFVAPTASAAAAKACAKKGGKEAPFLIGQRNIVL